jgi:TPP-dependent pyruvate/acetoin dehydrogenase alpha subunit
LAEWIGKDPLARAAQRLKSLGVEDLIIPETAAVEARIAAALEAAHSGLGPSADRVLEHVFRVENLSPCEA